MHDIDDKIKKLNRAVVWCNIYLVMLCAALIGFSLHVWQMLLTSEQRYVAIVLILKSKGIL